ncbi:hypothetical protein FA13DRAFT_199932 [Coprinellus micaceus]|uniref:Uncharacterized protein n=1 Tax=Coprinellus micaceus TaxID=71717 RepID=A0A4Y7SG32_COPMI|nr:hypothetical protein FA13DRAFT_199932 [Coprinellus micaceus]
MDRSAGWLGLRRLSRTPAECDVKSVVCSSEFLTLELCGRSLFPWHAPIVLLRVCGNGRSDGVYLVRHCLFFLLPFLFTHSQLRPHSSSPPSIVLCSVPPPVPLPVFSSPFYVPRSPSSPLPPPVPSFPLSLTRELTSPTNRATAKKTSSGNPPRRKAQEPRYGETLDSLVLAFPPTFLISMPTCHLAPLSTLAIPRRFHAFGHQLAVYLSTSSVPNPSTQPLRLEESAALPLRCRRRLVSPALRRGAAFMDRIVSERATPRRCRRIRRCPSGRWVIQRLGVTPI